MVHQRLFAKNARKNCPRRRIILHHGNAYPDNSYSAAATIEYLKNENVELMSHPYNDFFLFPKTKDKMRRIRFNTSEKAIQEFESNY